MPNPSKGPRLTARTERGRKVLVIRDGSAYRRTGCSIEDREQAEAKLKAYIEEKWRRPEAPRTAEAIMISEILAIYGEDHAPSVMDQERIGYAIDALMRFWGDLPVSSIKGETCRRYVRERGVADGTARRELGVLAAATHFCHREGFFAFTPPPVTLPPKSAPKDRWLTRGEAAALLHQARRWPHLARLILICLYTGSRSGVVRRLQWMPNTEGGHVDLEAGVLYRTPAAARLSNKRAPAARLPRKLLNHFRRWHRMADTRRWVVEWNGEPLAKNPKRTWAQAREAAGLGREVTPHVLRHSALTWMMQHGAKPVAVCSLAGITLAELERTYLHHSPDHQQSALDAFGG